MNQNQKQLLNAVTNLTLETISTDRLIGELVDRGFCKIDNCIIGNKFSAVVINSNNEMIDFTNEIQKAVENADIMIVGRNLTVSDIPKQH